METPVNNTMSADEVEALRAAFNADPEAALNSQAQVASATNEDDKVETTTEEETSPSQETNDEESTTSEEQEEDTDVSETHGDEEDVVLSKAEKQQVAKKLLKKKNELQDRIKELEDNMESAIEAELNKRQFFADHKDVKKDELLALQKKHPTLSLEETYSLHLSQSNPTALVDEHKVKQEASKANSMVGKTPTKNLKNTGFEDLSVGEMEAELRKAVNSGELIL